MSMEIAGIIVVRDIDLVIIRYRTVLVNRPGVSAGVSKYCLCTHEKGQPCNAYQ